MDTPFQVTRTKMGNYPLESMTNNAAAYHEFKARFLSSRIGSVRSSLTQQKTLQNNKHANIDSQDASAKSSAGHKNVSFIWSIQTKCVFLKETKWISYFCSQALVQGICVERQRPRSHLVNEIRTLLVES